MTKIAEHSGLLIKLYNLMVKLYGNPIDTNDIGDIFNLTHNINVLDANSEAVKESDFYKILNKQNSTFLDSSFLANAMDAQLAKPAALLIAKVAAVLPELSTYITQFNKLGYLTLTAVQALCKSNSLVTLNINDQFDECAIQIGESIINSSIRVVYLNSNPANSSETKKKLSDIFNLHNDYIDRLKLTIHENDMIKLHDPLKDIVVDYVGHNIEFNT